MAAEGPDRAAVRHDENGLAGVRAGDPLDGRDDALGELLARLAVVADLARLPAREAVREALVDLGAGEPRPRADVDLAERRVLDDREAEPLADDLRRLARPLEVARVDRGDAVVRQALRELGCLRRPVSLSGGSAWPCQRPMRFQSVSPWRARRMRVAGTGVG